MLFNSFVFLFAFLPLTLAALAVLHGRDKRPRMGAVILASLVFYGWFVPGHILLLLASALFNFAIGRMIQRGSARRAWLVVGLAGNLAALGFFKYADLLIGTVGAAVGADWTLLNILLPLAISFFTFQQIAYIVDVYRGEATPPPLIEYLLFVCFFPQLIAGPIVHHGEIIPQFRRDSFLRLDGAALLAGAAWFAVGLAKKTLIADQMAPISDAAFGLAESGAAVSFFEAWIGTLAFAFQIYFDFSGYSDMAIGLGLMLGLRLPVNFEAPYKAASIIGFWRRWHMTLSRFLRDYLYIPLGGGRQGAARRHVNLMVTMLLGGLWHGAAWTFVAWGALHGLYLVINHAWARLGRPLPRVLGWTLTMVAVCVAWTFFRAEGFDAAIAMLEGMSGLNGARLAAAHAGLMGPLTPALQALGVVFEGLPAVQLRHFPMLAGALFMCVALPTTQRLLPIHMLGGRPVAVVGGLGAVAAGLLLAAGALGIARASQFIYFQF